MTIQRELTRKLIHMSTMGIPIGYLVLGKSVILWIVGIALSVALFIEFARFFWSDFSVRFYKTTGMLLRKHERSDLTGATYLLLGSFIAIFFYEKTISIPVLFIVIIADSLSALFGKMFGRNIVYHGKSVEGCVVFILFSSIIMVFAPGISFLIGLAGVVTAFLVDIVIRKIDDNLTIPVIAGGAMQILWMLNHPA